MYRFNILSINITMKFFTEIEKRYTIKRSQIDKVIFEQKEPKL